MGSVNIVTSLVVIGIIFLLMFFYYWNLKHKNPLCETLALKLTPACWLSSVFIAAGRQQGDDCVVDSDCYGWTIGGNGSAGPVACCGSRCITKDQPFQTCIGFCDKNTCGKPQCSSCTTGSQCRGWSFIGSIECIGDKNTGIIGVPIKNGRCVVKDGDGQGLPSFWNRYTSGVDWCKNHNRSAAVTE